VVCDYCGSFFCMRAIGVRMVLVVGSEAGDFGCYS
jgi:hypothetical protein